MRAKNHTGSLGGTRSRNNKAPGNALPDGSGGTIAGGSMKPLDLMELLTRGDGGRAGGASSGAKPGAISGAIGVAALRAPVAGEGSVALSDGSRIVFASFAGGDILADA